MSSQTDSQRAREDLKKAVTRLRKDVTLASKDVASASKSLYDSTSKFVQVTSPKVSAAIDDGLEKASVTFTKTMTSIDHQTKPQQVRLLKAYRSFLSKQVDFIEKRLQKLKN